MSIQFKKSLFEWSADTKAVQYESLKRNINIDVCIVGAGITGLTCAFMLSKEGREVIVVDNGCLGSEGSYPSSPVIDVVDDGVLDKMENICVTENLKLNNERERKTILRVREIVESENIKNEISVVDGYLIFKPDGPAELTRDESPNLPNQVQLHMMKYLKSLCERFISRGGRIFSDPNIDIITDNGMIVLVTGNGCIVRAPNVIVTSNSPVGQNNGIRYKQGAYRTNVIAGNIPDGYVPKDLYWDKEKSYHYIRVKSAAYSR